MYFTAHSEVARSRDMTTAFGGYNHKLSCQDGEFSDMQNMTTAYYPMLSPRNKRGICREIPQFKTIVDKDGLYWTDTNGYLYENGEAVNKSYQAEDIKGIDYFVKMGAEIIGLPAMIAYNTETKKLNYQIQIYRYYNIERITPAAVDGTEITWHWDSYYNLGEVELTDGAYAMFKEDGKEVLKQWSETQGMWIKVKSSYVQIGMFSADGLEHLVGSEVKIEVNNSDGAYDSILHLFPTDEGDGWWSTTTTIIGLRTNPSWTPNSTNVTKYTGIIIEGTISDVLDVPSLESPGDVITLMYPRLEIHIINPAIAYAVECNNRIWGCSEDGHEIYACALGKWKEWNSYDGVSTDSYAATIGSDGKFTGAVTYQGNPIFFKENTMIKVTVSSTGAHQIKEISCPGVQSGSEKSICVINGVLYYKGVEGIYAYDGSLPVLVSSSLGEVRYHSAVSGTILDRYYVSMKDGNGLSHLFVYDTGTGMWAKEDNTDVKEFCRSGDELYYIDSADNTLKSIRGTLPYEDGISEGEIDWYAESGNIGFTLPDKKHLAKLQIRLSMELGTNVSIFLQYDSSGNWEHICNLSRTGTNSFVVPIIPRRCDHFKYMIAGRGGCKIFSVTKTIEEGSEL